MKEYLRERKRTEDRSKISGITLTVLLHAAAICLISFSGLKYIYPPPEETSFLIDYAEEEEVQVKPVFGREPQGEDVDKMRNATEKAKAKYEQARRKYGQFGDANQDIQLQSYQLQQEELENDMQLKYNEYTTMNTQLQQAAAKIQEKTPVFTLIKGAEVPIKPAGPKRMIFALVMTVLAAFILSVIILRKDIFKVFA